MVYTKFGMVYTKFGMGSILNAAYDPIPNLVGCIPNKVWCIPNLVWCIPNLVWGTGRDDGFNFWSWMVTLVYQYHALLGPMVPDCVPCGLIKSEFAIDLKMTGGGPKGPRYVLYAA